MSSVRTVALGVSGGVDSAVAGLLLKKKGFNVLGVFMKNWDLADETGVCTISNDREDARYVCERLKIPFLEVNFVKEYWNEVFMRFTEDYEKGYTPNPDVLCNKFIKFKAFVQHAMKNLNADAIATGHYARTSFGDYLENHEADANVKLLKPKDPLKDQTFFLSQVPQEGLRKTMFPLGNLKKDEVKRMAVENGLQKIAKKEESTGICFIGHRKFQNFISEYVSPKPGKFINIITGKVEGVHDGIHMWTLGQRCRLASMKEPMYVVKKNPENGDILIAPGYSHPSQFSSTFFTGTPYWLTDPPTDLSSYVQKTDFRFQHTRPLVQCDLFELKSKSLLGVLERPLRALTPGQFAVFYKGNECLGSARITETGPSEYSLGNEVPEDIEEYPETLNAVSNNQ